MAIPLGLQAGLSPEIAVTIAVPIGLLGVLLDNLKRTYHSYFVHLADKAIEENNIKILSSWLKEAARAESMKKFLEKTGLKVPENK